jgi:hypothetical protein
MSGVLWDRGGEFLAVVAARRRRRRVWATGDTDNASQAHSTGYGCRVHEREREPAMFAVNRKVGIQGQCTMIFMNFRHANDAGICQ